MRKDEVPQQNAKAFMGHSKLLYAEDREGHYVGAPCSGWEAEEIVLDQAIEEYVELAREAWRKARDGQGSTLVFHMYRQRMDVALLAQSTGFMRWRVRRDLRPDALTGMPRKRLERYADALGLSVAALAELPEAP